MLLHGEFAAFAGQGRVRNARPFRASRATAPAGTIHIIINKQIGFTTAPHHSRSSPYPHRHPPLMVEARSST